MRLPSSKSRPLGFHVNFASPRSSRYEGGSRGQVVQDLLLLPDDVAEQREVQAIADEWATDLPIQLPPARQLASDLAGDQVRAIEPLGLQRSPERPFDHVPAPQGHDFHETALGASDVGAGTEATDLEGLDPAGAGEQQGAAQARMVD